MAGGPMLLYFSLAARLVPLLLLLSAILVGTRWLYDLPPLRSHHVNTFAAAIVMLGGLAAALPYALRMGLMVGIRSAVDEQDLPLAELRVIQYQRLGGTMDGSLLYIRALAHAREGRLEEAVPDFRAALQSHDPLLSPPLVAISLGKAYFALHRDDEAKAILSRLPEAMREAPTRDYLLGRIAERQGRQDAEAWFRRSLALDPGFFPSLYRLLRILSLRHDVRGADAVLETFRRDHPEETHMVYLDEIDAAVHRGEVLADYDPFRLPVQTKD